MKEPGLLLKIWGYVWAFPQTLIGLLVAIYYWPSQWRWSQGCLEAVAREKKNGDTSMFGQPAGQTWGWLIFYSDSSHMQFHSGLRVHERVHVYQAFIGGPLFTLAYALHWLILMPMCKFNWYDAYMKVWAERMAYRIQREFRDGRRPNAWGRLNKGENA